MHRRTTRSPFLSSGLLGLGIALAGCQGSVSEPGGFERPYRPGSHAGPDDEGGSAGEYCSVAPTPLRRLSHREYENTLSAVFPSVELPDLQLPEDQRPHEFDNDVEALGASSLLVERYVDVGEVVASRVVADAPEDVMVCADPSEDERLGCGEQIVRTVGRRLFRRPLTDEQVREYTRFFRAPEGASFDEQVELTLTFMLAAPEFLYRFEEPIRPIGPGETAPLDPYSLASRLSFFLWESGPDDALLDAAGSGELSTEAGLRAQAERMLEDERARAAFVRFHEQWLDFERLDLVTKAEADGFDDALRESMRTESRMFVEHVLFDEGGTVADLLTSNRTFVNARLAELYGVEPPSSEWAEVELPDRSGFLTQATFLASHAHPDKPSPVLRGVFLLERVLCSELGAPPPNAEAMAASATEEVSGPLTNRQLYDLMTEPAQCQACHERINPAGYAFEHYDTMGRYRETEDTGLEIDASGQLEDFAFTDANDLAAQLAASERVQRCVARKWVRFAFGGGPMENASCFVDDLTAEMLESGGSIRDLQMAIVLHPSFATMVGQEVAE